MKKVDIYSIANWYLTKESMTHKKLQKLCYYTQAWHLALMGKALINAEFQAWVHGPISPVLYQKYAEWGWQKIPKNTLGNDCSLKKDISNFLEIVWKTYGHLDGDQLESITHREDPWREVRGNIGELDNCENIISHDSMKRFYKAVYEKNQGE